MQLASQVPEKERKLYKLLSLWYENNVDGQLADSTCRSYQLAIKHIRRFCFDLHITEIDEEKMQNCLNAMTKWRYSKSTINKVKIVIKNAVIFAVRIKWIKYPPLMKLYIPKIAPTKKIDALTRHDQVRVEQLCRTPGKTKYGHITLFLLNTGLRSDELYHLKWQDFYDEEKPYIIIRKSKTENGLRKVPLTSEALSIIKNQPEINEYIFNSINGCPLSQTQMKRHNKEIRETLGIEKFHNHICRHTFATRAVENNVDISALSKILGHSSVAFTRQRYVTVFDDFLFEQMNLLEDNIVLEKEKPKSNNSNSSDNTISISGCIVTFDSFTVPRGGRSLETVGVTAFQDLLVPKQHK